jgi:mevalonate kinase
MIAHGRASGKIILLGEHAVVYGCPAIAAGIALGATATANRAEASTISLDIEIDSTARRALDHAFAALLGELHCCQVAVKVKSEIPPGLGLGASAALGVAVARAVLTLNASVSQNTRAGVTLDLRQRVNAAAVAWETVFHGRSSGLDVAAAALGGCLMFTKQRGPQPLRVHVDIPVAVAIAGPAMSTKTMVDAVAALRRREPDLVARSIEGIRSLVESAQLALEAGDLPSLGRLLDLNQALLAGLFLSTESIERACAIARTAGALGAKLTGKGGGGCVIALTEPDPQPVLDAWRSDGIECFATVIRTTA